MNATETSETVDPSQIRWRTLAAVFALGMLAGVLLCWWTGLSYHSLRTAVHSGPAPNNAQP